MKNRYVNTKFWSDSYIVKLDKVEKLLFLYLLTNEKTNIAGIYELPIKVMSFETGIEINLLEDLLKRFGRDDKIYFCDGWVFIKNFLKHQSTTSQKVKKGVENELKLIPEEIFREFSEKCDIKGILDTLSIPYTYPIIYSNSNSNSNLDRDRDSEDRKSAPLSSSSFEYPSEEPDNYFVNSGLVSEKKKNKQVNNNSEIEKPTEEEEREAEKLILHFEKVYGRRIPRTVKTITSKNRLVEVDMNVLSAKRMLKIYSLDEMKMLIELYFRERDEVPENERKFIPRASNITTLEEKLHKIMEFIELRGLDPFTGKRYKNAPMGKGEIDEDAEFEEFMRKKREIEKNN